MEKKNYIVAIDLGSSNVTVIVGSRNSDETLHIDDFAMQESEGVVRGEIKNIEQVSQSIKEAVNQVEQRLDIKITEAYTGISGQHIKFARDSYYVYIGRDGEIKEEDVQKLKDNMRNVKAPDGQSILDVIPQNYIVDNEEVDKPVGMFGQKLEATFNFIIGENLTVSRLEKALMKVDLRQSQMFINPLVTAEAVVLPEEKEMGVAVLDIGAGTTDVCVYTNKCLRYVGVVGLGAAAINKDIRDFGILERYVEDLKVKYGSALSSEASKDKLIKVPGRTAREPKEISFYNLSAIIEARLLDIIDYAMEEIKRSGYEDKLGAGIVVTGGCARLKDIDKLITQHTGHDVRIAAADVWVDEPSREKASDPRLATGIGLVLKAMQAGKSSKVDAAGIRNISSTLSSSGTPVTGNRSAGIANNPEPDSPTRDDDYKRKKKDSKINLSGWIDKIKEKFEVLDDDTAF